MKEVVGLKNRLFEILAGSEDHISGQALAARLGVSRQAVWKGIKALRDEGFVIDSVAGKGYKLTEMPIDLNELAVRYYLKTSNLGKNLIVLDSVGSTNDYLKQLGSEGCESGTVVTAHEQTKGKGRLGRSWESKRDDNLMFSILLRPRMAPKDMADITPLTGLAICQALRDYTGLDLKIKWPNDIIIGKKKLVGILTEMSAEFDAVEYIVTGIGINVDQTTFPDEIAHKATSLLLETGRHYDKNRLLAGLLGRIEEEFTRSSLALSAASIKEYKKLCATIGRSVTFKSGTRSISGVAVDIDEDGALKVMLSDGSLRTVNAGEVTVQGIY